MRRSIQLFCLLCLSVLWLAIVVPGTVSERGVYWEGLLMLGVLPVAILWGLFALSLLKKRRK